MRRRLAGLWWSAQAAVVLVGAPFMLRWLPTVIERRPGWPFPNRVPAMHEVGHALSSRLPADFLGVVIFAAAWAAWLWFGVLPLVLEVASRATNRTTPRLPMGLGQGWAWRVVTGVLLLVPTGAHQTARPTQRLAGTLAVAEVEIPERPILPAAFVREPVDRAPVSALPPQRPSALASEARYKVRRGDSIWRVAKARLAAVVGRRPTNQETNDYTHRIIGATPTLAPPRNPDLIYAGEELVEPAVIDERSVPTTDSLPPPATPPTADPGRLPLGETKPTPQPPPPPRSPLLPSQASGARSADDPPRHSVPDRARGAKGRNAHADDFPLAYVLGAVGVVGSPFLCAWAVEEYRRRHAERLRRSRSGQEFPPDASSADPTFLRAVAAAADPRATSRVEVALAHLSSTAGVRPIAVLSHPDGRIDVHLAEPESGAEGGWSVLGDGHMWTLPPDVDLPEVSDFVPSPALAVLGSCEGGAEVLVDLEAIGYLGLGGALSAARQIARALVACLAVSPLAEFCRVLTLGFDPFGLEEQVPLRVIVADSGEALVTEVESCARVVTEAVDLAGAQTSFRLRALERHDGFEPVVSIIAAPLGPDLCARLRRACDNAKGGAAVVSHDPSARWCLEPAEGDGWWLLKPLGLRIRPIAAAADELRELTAYLAAADVKPISAPLPAVAKRDALDGAAFEEREWAVMVRVLGPVDIINRAGMPQDSERGQPVELLAWLATHRKSSTRTAAAEALWGGREIDPRTLRNVLSITRLLLRKVGGEPPDGEWIVARQEVLPLHRLVVTDYDLLVDRLEFAKSADDATAERVLSEGLALFRGLPFEDQHWRWIDDLYLVSDMRINAATLATELAMVRLRLGDIQGAFEAVGVGLRMIPYHDHLTEVTMRAWIESGDRNAALAVYEAYERGVVARGGAVHDDVAALRNELHRAARTSDE